MICLSKNFSCDNQVIDLVKDPIQSSPINPFYFMQLRESTLKPPMLIDDGEEEVMRPPPGFEHFPQPSNICQINEENLQYLVSTWSNSENSFEQINEICSRGFDELNLLIQEQRWVQNSFNCPNPSSHVPGTHVGSASSLIVPEYFIFKCKKVALTTWQLYQVLAMYRPDFPFNDFIRTFQSWKESISAAEIIHREEDEYLLSYPMNERSFARLTFALNELICKTQQARTAFQYATLNLSQLDSRPSFSPISNTRRHPSHGSSTYSFQSNPDRILILFSFFCSSSTSLIDEHNAKFISTNISNKFDGIEIFSSQIRRQEYSFPLTSLCRLKPIFQSLLRRIFSFERKNTTLPLTMSTRMLGQCSVCGDNAVGINFGVPTCAPCKAFFRRNAVKLGRRDFLCQQDGDCPVTYKSRRLCNCCRLAKCFQVGMQKSLIRSEAEREARKQLVEQNRKKRIQTKETSLIRPSTLLLSFHSQPVPLSGSDQTLLTNIMGAYERTCLVDKHERCPAFPRMKHSSVHQLLNDYSERQKSLVKYFKIIPEFDALSMYDKIRLIRNHFCITLTINEAVLATDISQKLLDSIASVFNNDIACNLIRCIELVHTYTNDRILLKLLLIVRALSSDINRYRNDVDMDRIFDNTSAIFAAQNVYVELLWRYLLSRLPSEAHAVKFYNKLIRDLLYVQRVCFLTESHINPLTEEIMKMEPLMQSMWPLHTNSNESNIRAVEC